MALKGALTFLEMVARLIRGYTKATGRQPDNLAKLKINMEAAERIKQQNKVTDFPKDRITPFNEPRPGDVKKNVEEVYFDNPNDPRLFKPNIKTQAQDLKTFGKEVIDELNAPIKPDLEEVVPIKKVLSDKEATAQINKLRENFDFNDRKQVLQLFDDIDAGKAFGAFDDIQRKELRDMISDMYTRKPEFASGGIAGELHLNEGGRARFQDGALAAYKKGVGMWNPDKSLVSVGINPGTGTPEWMYPHEAAAMGIFPTMDYEGNKIAPASTPVAGDKEIVNQLGRQNISNKGETGGILDLASPFTTFLTGGKLAPRTDAMNRNLEEIVASKISPLDIKKGNLSGTIGYSDYDKSQAVGTAMPNLDSTLKNLVSRDVTPAEFGNLTQMGRLTYDVDPMTGKINLGSNTYDFRPEVAEGPGFFANRARKANEISRAITPDLNLPGFNTPRMQAAADKGMDARMGRTYAENKQIMADPRMNAPMGAAKGGLAKILGV